MNAVALTQIVLNVFISASLSMFFSLIGTLNIICFQLMIKLDYPGNVQLIMGTILRLLNAELLDPTLLDQVVFDFSTDVLYVEAAIVKVQKMFLSQQIYDVGFETYNPVLNLGGLYFIFLFILINMTVLAAFKLVMLFLKVRKPISSLEEGGQHLTTAEIQTKLNLGKFKYYRPRQVTKKFGQERMKRVGDRDDSDSESEELFPELPQNDDSGNKLSRKQRLVNTMHR